MAFPVIPVIGELFGIGRDYLANKREEKQAKHERKVELIRQQGSWEEIMAEGSTTSWKDEFWTLVLAVPLMLCFLPGMEQYVISGFEAIGSMPDWYQYLLSICIAASFGVRNAIGAIKKVKK